MPVPLLLERNVANEERKVNKGWTMKKILSDYIESYQDKLWDLGDRIFDYSEPSFQEVKSSALLEQYLEQNGFAVEKGIAGLPTAFKAVYKNGQGGPAVGLLCEYDALEGLGHGCGHHLQGPAIVGAAKAIKDKLREKPYTLVIYGTPGEETTGGKVRMVQEGCFKDIDLAIMVHGGSATQTDVKSMALISADVVFHGKTSHAAISPELGRSALDALLLTFNGIEFLREHVKDDTRIHYTVSAPVGPANAVPARAEGQFDLRSYNSIYLDEIIRRFENIVKGAALMTDTTYDISYGSRFESKIPAYQLNRLLMANAKLVGAPNLKPDRERTGSTDFGNVVFQIPGACVRVAFVPDGTASHSQGFLDGGKSEAGHNMIAYAAKIVAMTVYDLVDNPVLVDEIKKEFTRIKQEMGKE
jgi:amidohydrolase